MRSSKAARRRPPFPAAWRYALIALSLAAGVGAALYYPPAVLSRIAAGVDVGAVVGGPVRRCLGADQADARPCLLAYFDDRVRQAGAEAALSDLQVLNGRDLTVRDFCHPLAHEIGHAAFLRYGDVATAFAHGDDTCWSGYYHGVLETFTEGMDRSAIARRIDGICAPMKDAGDSGRRYYTCIHGLGHGLLAVAEDSLTDALALCDALDGEWQRKTCYGGVFMQNVVNEEFDLHKPDFRADDPLYPCDAVADRYKELCYNRQTAHLLRVGAGDFGSVFAACASVTSLRDADACYYGIGRDAFGSTGGDLVRARSACLGGRDGRQREACAAGAARFIAFYESEWKAKLFCATLFPSSLRAACGRAIAGSHVPFGDDAP